MIIPIATGTIGSVVAPYNTGRTATHEVGHWLGLRHLWGDGDCSVDDYCGDTPRCSDAFFSSFPSCFTPNQCGATRMIENYMDYSDGGCMNVFTIKQKSRMDAVLANSPNRPYSETIPTVCHPFEYAKIKHTPKTMRSCGAANINFSNHSEALPSSLSWTFSGIQLTPLTSTLLSPNITVSSTGLLNAQLEAFFSNLSEIKSTSISVIILPPNDTRCLSPTCFDGVKNGNEIGIDCGGSCVACDANCDKALVYNGPFELIEDQKAVNLIEAGNLTGAGNIQINAGQTITLQAGQNIILQPGFNVSPSAVLHVQIGGCP
ncbi:MAG: hypothetical protein IPL46_21725 [Saprospiraceae bacterium]|nr:hypothetical protein [Saprospiraceae bacterium]